MRLARVVLLSALSTLAWRGEARAVGIASPESALRVREELILIVLDGRREHVLHAARLEPAAGRAIVALPVPTRPEVQLLEGVDLAAALHLLVAAPEELATGRRPPPPAPWPPAQGASARPVDLADPGATGALGLDPGWVRSLGPAWLAVTEVATPEPKRRLEIATPTLRVSFETARPGLVLREPRLVEKPADPEEAQPAAAREPYAIESISTAPEPDAPSAAAVEKVLRMRALPLRACYDTYLAARPGATAVVDVQVVITRKGETESAIATAAAAADAEATALGKCVAGAVRAKSFPRVDRAWRFTARVRFTPPPAPSRRTRVVLLGKERLRWSAPPPGASLVRELEPTWEDLGRAFDPATRAAVGLGGTKARVWLSEYVDTTERRQDEVDLVLAATPIPAEGEPGTHAAVERPTQKEAPPAPERPRATAPRRERGHAARNFLVAAAIASVIAAAIALAFSQDR